MKKNLKRGFSLVICLAVLLALLAPALQAAAAANANPTWYVDARVINHRQLSPYDYYGAKDPTIVYSGGKYHVFYTGANQSGGWQMLYTSASTIAGLASAPRTYMSKIGESYFCAPEVFYFEPKGLWYLVYQDGTYGAAYATTTNIADPNSWSGPKSFGISGNMGWDYFVICDDTYAYMYNTPDDGSGRLYMRKTTLANFPAGWSAPTVAMSGVFEGAEVYKCIADGKYYLLIEDQKDGRYYELWTSSSAGGPWSIVAEKWAWRGNLKYNADQWTTNVSHGELIRAGSNQKLEINDINRVDFLIQGTTNLNVTYQQIIWDLGVIHNYTGSNPTPTPTPSGATPTPTPSGSTPTPGGTKVECENMTLGGSYAGKISSPFSGVALYANNDYCAYTQNFGLSTHSFSVRGASNNSSTARVDLKIGGTTVGSFYFTGTTPTVQTLSNISHATGNQEIRLTVTTDTGAWDAYVDYFQIN